MGARRGRKNGFISAGKELAWRELRVRQLAAKIAMNQQRQSFDICGASRLAGRTRGERRLDSP